MKQKVGLIFGGRSGEHEVSLQSAMTIAANLDAEKFELFPILISREGKWYGPIAMEEVGRADWRQDEQQEIFLAPKPGGQLLLAANGASVTVLDVVFPIIHGTGGEDGSLQGLLELAGIPYVGAGVAASALGMDKLLMRELLAYHQVPQTRFVGILRAEVEENLAQCLQRCRQQLLYPMFVKPANGGSSVGISKADNDGALAEALLLAARYDRKIIVEQGVNAREIEISVLGNWSEICISQPGEIISSNDFYDYEAKYLDEQSITQIPADLPEATGHQIQQLALTVYRALDCEGFARIDFFVEKTTGQVYLNEINTLPGFTAISMYPKMWEAGGLPIEELLTRLVILAQERFADKQRIRIHR